MATRVPKDKEYKALKKCISEITSRKTFDEVLENCMLCDEQKKILVMRYVNHYELSYIGDMLNVSYTTVKRWHAQAVAIFVEELKRK